MISALCWIVVVSTGVADAADDGIDVQSASSQYFHEQVEPILRRRCLACHSHSAEEISGGLALDWRSGWELGGDRGPAIVPGMPEQSLLMQAIRHQSEDLRMPEQKLSADEIAVFELWIKNGAFDDRLTAKSNEPLAASDWWSIRSLAKPTVPEVDADHPIDAFIIDGLRKADLQPSERADRRTLIRRVSYDLTGLPPSPEDLDAFVLDDDHNAYEKLVERLLASPRYGERWTRHWLDAIHFADSHGYEHDIGRDHAWRFRDYVIDAMNQDKPWSRFVCEQLATDYFYPTETHLAPALGFLGAGTFDLSTFSTGPVTFDYLDRDDLVTQTMAAFASTTANCARCHDHKFDPISQEDYYALQAVFAGVVKGNISFDLEPETAQLRHRLQSIMDACDQRDVSVLNHPDHVPRIAEWIEEYLRIAPWQTLHAETFLSTDGATLSRDLNGVLLASGVRPERDTYVITASTALERITAIRLDVHSHESLPMKGPGRCDNGNLHLSEFELHAFEPASQHGRKIKIKAATADFNQTGWGIERALDGDTTTAWGIHPAVGISHYAVFELDEPLVVTPGTKIAISLRQLHGGSHLIGALSLSVTTQAAPFPNAIPMDVARAASSSSEARTSDDWLTVAAYVLRSDAMEAMRKLPPKAIVYAAAANVEIPAGNGQVQSASIASPKIVHRLHRGDFDKPREVSEPGSLSIFANISSRFALKNPTDEAERRAALAQWIVHRDNGLTWRSIVNRVWHHHFGQGICDTPGDLGRMGGVPSSPELIDWLATWFRDDAGGSLKSLHRLIVTSETYCQSSNHRAEPSLIDNENRLFWRQNRQRLDADAIRDCTLAASGSLYLSMGGPGVQHFTQSKGPQSTPTLDYMGYDWSKPDAARRSVYRYVWRGIADPFMEAMDFPDLGLLAPVRGFSASSLQALSLYNNDFILHHSEQMARNIEAIHPEVAQQVTECVRRVWLRSASPEEQVQLTTFVKQNSLAELCRILLNSNEFLFVD